MRAAAVARRGGDPEVGRAGVEVNDERLRRVADGDLARPKQIVLLVGQVDASALRRGGDGDRGERLDLRALGERLAADVLLEVDEVLAVLAVDGTVTRSVETIQW